MRTKLMAIAAGAAAAIALATGCSSEAGTEHAGEHSSPTSTAAASAESAAPSSQEHNEADVMFAQHMIPHHEQAVEMSDIVLGKQGIDPRVTELATQIKAAQAPEIEQMQGWLDEWGNPPMPPMTPSEGHDGHDMGGMSGDMMGMMSPEQMTALRNAEGVDASRLFLSGMITHHEGAIDMAQTEIRNGKFQPAIDLAHSIETSQQKEIDEMKGILGAL